MKDRGTRETDRLVGGLETRNPLGVLKTGISKENDSIGFWL